MLLCLFFIHRTTVNDKMSTEEFAVQYVDKLLDFHIPNQMAPSQYLTWGNLTKCPALLMDSHLDGLDWDTFQASLIVSTLLKQHSSIWRSSRVGGCTNLLTSSIWTEKLATTSHWCCSLHLTVRHMSNHRTKSLGITCFWR